MFNTSLYNRIYSVVRRIPSGNVATYGQIAALAGMGGHARQVGYALHNLPANSDVPWHRVVNAKGGISMRSDGYSHKLQKSLLETEGVLFNEKGQIPLDKYRWRS
jgi:methylated-DNA-protein-cysteine methyltransferase-like protein